MKVETKKSQPEFEPFVLTISIETRREFEILMSIFATSKEHICKFVKEQFKTKDYSDEEIDYLTDQIYKALKFE